MTRMVNADIVVAALQAIKAGLDESRRVSPPSVGVSNARFRVQTLINQIESQAEER